MGLKALLPKDISIEISTEYNFCSTWLRVALDWINLVKFKKTVIPAH